MFIEAEASRKRSSYDSVPHDSVASVATGFFTLCSCGNSPRPLRSCSSASSALKSEPAP